MKKKRNTHVFYNHGDSPIFIARVIKVDHFGGPGQMETKMIISPGDGVDVSCLGLKRTKPRSLK
jgi:hypothetical protein